MNAAFVSVQENISINRESARANERGRVSVVSALTSDFISDRSSQISLLRGPIGNYLSRPGSLHKWQLDALRHIIRQVPFKLPPCFFAGLPKIN